MSTFRSRALAASLAVPTLLGAGALAPSAQASTPTHVYHHGDYDQAHFATAANCASHAANAARYVKARHATSIALGSCHAVASSVATTSPYTYDLTYRAKTPAWSSDTDLGTNPATSAAQHSFLEVGHASTARDANASITAAKSHVARVLGASVSWTSGAVKSASGGYVWELDVNSRYAPSATALETRRTPGLTNVLMLKQTSGTTAPTQSATDQGVTTPGGGVPGWTSGTTHPSQPAIPTSPSQTTSSNGSTTTTTTQPGTGTVTTTTTSGGSSAQETVGVAGIDISPYTSLSNYSAWKAKGIDFLFSKATEGTYYTSKVHNAQMAGAQSAGIIAGSYDFANPATDSAVNEADYYLSHGGGWKPNSGMLPDALDIEYNPYGATCYGLSKSALTQWTNDWVNEIHNRTGSYPFVYSTANYVNQCLDTSALNPHTQLWLARYSSTPGTIPSPWSNEMIWQNAAMSSQGYDTDIFNGTMSGLQTISNTGIN